MEKKQYQHIVKKHTPKEDRLYNGMLAFISGGLMGVLGHFIMNLYSYYLNIPTSLASTYMIVTLIFLGCLLTCLGFFDKWVTFFKAGLIVPITGFAHSMMGATLEYRKEGIITGIGANMFKLAGTVIIHGVVAAYIFAVIRIIILGG